jgi:oxygen-independent coproporphyrinogen-3 oxidase
VLTQEDLAVRQHILNIMCKGYTTWNVDMRGILIGGLERLKPLADDGLIELTPSGLTVTETGKRYLRNICMALDERLWADKPTTQLFSMAV